MIGFPFDSHVTYDEDGTPVYDRAISSEPYRRILKNLFSTGVLPDDENFKVVAGEGMSVVVQAGFAMVEGLMKLEEDSTRLAIAPADDNYARIDTVVLRLDDNDAVRSCDLFILQGEAALDPVEPALTREGSIYELGFANILVRAGVAEITTDDITDTRKANDRCGVVDSVNSLPELIEDVAEHVGNRTIHITADERTKWNRGILYDGDLEGRLQDIEVSTVELEKNAELATGKLYVVYEE